MRKVISIFPLAAVLAAMTALGSPARPQPAAGSAAASQFGSVNFLISCQPQVQAQFNQAVAMLDSFQYEQSLQTFAAVAKQDPQCAIAYWGQAMSLYHQLWDWPQAQTLKQGLRFIEQAQKASVKSAREQAYIHAAAVYYQDNPKLTGEARAEAYSQAMAQLHARYPNDDEGTAFYALSLIAQRTRNQATEMAHRKQAIAMLQKLFVEQPDNPGVAHYLIHAADTPALAALGLQAARRYARIAPGSAHALHMPSYIFTDLGLWQESIASNIASAAAADHATTSGEYDASGHQFHAMTFLEYAYLQSGRNADARRVILELKKVPGSKPSEIADLQADFRVEMATETHNWKQAAELAGAPGLYAQEKEQLELARTLGAALTGNLNAARKNLQQLNQQQAAVTAGRHSPARAPRQKSVDQLVAEAWVDYAAGNSAQSLAKMRQAAAMQDDDAWKDGDAAVQIPPREMLGDLLMKLNQPAQALGEYQAVLKQSPNRFDALYGAASAAEAAGNAATAHQYFAQLLKICGPQADRPELQQARTYLAER